MAIQSFIETLIAAAETHGAQTLDPHLPFRVIFRLLAAKVLQDRNHHLAKKWNYGDLPSLLQAMESHYSLAPLMAAKGRTFPAAFLAAWDHIRNSISFSNISADDLAFVYENMLVTPETRKQFGAHCTPRQVAEYVVQRLELHKYPLEKLKIYEPFAGSGVFLVSALRRLRDLLPIDWSDRRRHNFLVRHLAGDEIDAFACEVATLSLILADYPKKNGWHIRETDLFEKDALQDHMRGHNVILCNPPFGAFTDEERGRYRITGQNHSKPAVVLNAALDANPLALGFVLPRSFILDKNFAEQRRRIERLYGSVELVALPENIFSFSSIESTLLIAGDRRLSSSTVITLRSTEIADRDRGAFLKIGKTTTQRHFVRPITVEATDELWIPSLAALWQYLDSYPRLGTKLRPSRGLEWFKNQSRTFSDQAQLGFCKGLHSARRFRQFKLNRPVWLDYRRDNIRRGYDQHWEQPKLIASAGSLSRGPWRIGAALDKEGFPYPQQFFGLWPKTPLPEKDLLALSAVLNGPVANAFMSIHSTAKGIRLSAVEQIPIPLSVPDKIADLVAEYTSLLKIPEPLRQDEKLAMLLTLIDAAILEAYDLPPRLEHQLFDYFLDAVRPVAHPWTHWDIADPMPELRLAERVSGRFRPRGNWITEVFRPLSEREAALLRKYCE